MPKPDKAVFLPSDAILKSHYPSLNGLRGISIIMVVVAHLHLGGNEWMSMLFNGSLGVNIFFVLSGFLITSLCLREQDATGGLRLTKFYTRRVLRIFPIAYLYLLVMLVLNLIFQLSIKWFQFAGAAAYLMNFSYFRSHDFSWFTGHYWSLSVEEQFYILFPIILKINRKVFYYCVLFIVFGLPVVCALQEVFPSINSGLPYFITHYFIKFQSIATGCLLALLVFRKVLDQSWLQTTKVPGNLVALVLIVWLRFDDFYSVKAILTNGIISLLTAYIVVTNIVPSGNVFYRFLNLKWLSFIGVLSYSIYIWQQLFTSGDARLSLYVVSWPFNLVWIIVVPVISYYGFERYFLKLKNKFKVVNATQDSGM
ncbi:acyltransferase [Mucilaginibacter terrenus]|uniref:Acyltransferase n=1 Tax=Mucilaginibacter terrenus TaxID=2482727 RepID=A0A3E2NWY3_9SPHI|nr:acyltransferase [Mucilaginibacter terrenus]RFZ85525.1 acyltransferase [Mucilaginibacter terrenus]